MVRVEDDDTNTVPALKSCTISLVYFVTLHEAHRGTLRQPDGSAFARQSVKQQNWQSKATLAVTGNGSMFIRDGRNPQKSCPVLQTSTSTKWHALNLIVIEQHVLVSGGEVLWTDGLMSALLAVILPKSLMCPRLRLLPPQSSLFNYLPSPPFPPKSLHLQVSSMLLNFRQYRHSLSAPHLSSHHGNLTSDNKELCKARRAVFPLIRY